MTGAHHRPERRARVYGFTGGRCTYCGRALSTLPRKERQLDHMVPGPALLRRSGRGPWRAAREDNTDPNLAPACGPCNRQKRGRTESEWAEDLEEMRAMEDDGPACADSHVDGVPF